MKYYTKGGQSQKSNRHIRKRTITGIVTFIQENLNTYTVSQLCSALKFPRSTYYKALICVPSDRQQVYQAFSRQIKEAFDASKGRYGAVKICCSLNDNGIPCSLKRVQRHMNRLGVRSVVVKKYNLFYFKSVPVHKTKNICAILFLQG